MKKNILTIGLITALGIGLFSAAANSRAMKTGSGDESTKAKIKQILNQDYSNEDLLNILADIENSIQSSDTREVRAKAEEVSNYIAYRKNGIMRHKGRYSSNNVYNGDKVLELKYGNWFNSKELVLPLAINHKPLKIELVKNRMALAALQTNEIDSARVRYVSYDIGNKKTGSDLSLLLSSLEEGSASDIRGRIQSVYTDILVDHDGKISLVAKIRDNLALAKFLLENNQAKAAQNSIGFTDSLMLRLIEIKADSPIEQRKIENLRAELNNIAKVSDDNYISEWEKIPEEVEGWWKKK